MTHETSVVDQAQRVARRNRTGSILHRVEERSRTEVSERESGDEQPACPECEGQLRSDDEHGETVCTDCGLVVDEGEVDPGPEWRAFDPGETEHRSRVGAPATTLIHDNGLSTSIDWRNADTHGSVLSPRRRRRMQRLRTWDERFRTRDSRERNLKQALGEIERMASVLCLPRDIRETASVIYRRALEDDLLPGRSIEGIATAALYAAARQIGTPRTLTEIAAVSRIDPIEFKRAYRYLVRELALEIEPADPEQYLPRFSSELGLDAETERRARDLLRAGKAKGLYSGKSPVGLAAAAIYAGALLTNEIVTQKDISAVADVSDVTIRNRYRELLEAADATREVLYD